jgi:hypothetical protein
MGHDNVEEFVRKRQAVEDVTYVQLAFVDSIATDTASCRDTRLNPRM